MIAAVVARSPSRLCSRDGMIFCYGDALSTIFLRVCVRALLPTFRFSFFSSFVSYFFRASRYFYLLRVSSSVQQQSDTVSKYIFYSTCSFCLLCICTLPHLGILLFCLAFFFVALNSPVAFCCCCAFVPGTPVLVSLALNL